MQGGCVSAHAAVIATVQAPAMCHRDLATVQALAMGHRAIATVQAPAMCHLLILIKMLIIKMSLQKPHVHATEGELLS
jgi:hypothetical protein